MEVLYNVKRQYYNTLNKYIYSISIFIFTDRNRTTCESSCFSEAFKYSSKKRETNDDETIGAG